MHYADMHKAYKLELIHCLKSVSNLDIVKPLFSTMSYFAVAIKNYLIKPAAQLTAFTVCYRKSVR